MDGKIATKALLAVFALALLLAIPAPMADAGSGNTGAEFTARELGASGPLAPGRSGTFASPRLSGTAEADLRVSYWEDFRLEGSWTDRAGRYYCPLVVTVGGRAVHGNDYDCADAFEAAVDEAASALDASCPMGADLSAYDVEVYWEWPRSGERQTGEDNAALCSHGVLDDEPEVGVSSNLDVVVRQA